MRRGITEKYYEIATYVREEHLKKFGNLLQDATREAMRRVLAMKEEDIIAVPEEKVKEELKGAIWKVVYTDDAELHRKWLNFPKQLKKWLHYWVNKKLEVIELRELQKREIKERAKHLTFYLFGKVAELYRQGFFSSEVILSVLQELKDKPDEIKVWTVKEYEYKRYKLGEAVRVFINFKNYQELRDWYATLPVELRRGVWIATHYRLLDKFQNLWYNITHQDQ
ncbi:hypothetical protein [uncultured virus]|uniref:Uncharacterized protein n=1 Tax=uncultured virus TaxID=340016 RepID=A0A5Q0TWP5_9VIRU|nr:hypothetical protein [uncultured virus]